MPIEMSLEAKGIEAVAARYRRAPRTVADYIEKNLRGLGKILVAKMRRELAPVKYTGKTERSVSTEYEASPPWYTLRVGPTAPEAKIVRTGSRPHVPPIGPLKKWAVWKLGDEKAAYAVQKSIAKHGTSRYLQSKGLGVRVSGHGIGLDFPGRTLARGDTQTAIQRTTARIPLDVARAFETGE